MKQHWKILIWMAAGALLGGVFQVSLEAEAESGLVLDAGRDAAVVREVRGPAVKAGLEPGMELRSILLDRGRAGRERRIRIRGGADLEAALEGVKIGAAVWFAEDDAGKRVVGKPLTLVLRESSPRARWIAPFAYGAALFMTLLKMLIVPLVLTSIISGVAGVGAARDLKRLGLKTILYYVTTSMIAILVGLVLVNLIRPGEGAELGLPYREAHAAGRSFWDVFLRMVPTNFFSSLGDNGAMLQIIFFGLFFGGCILATPAPHGPRLREFFTSAFEVMMKMAELVLRLIPYGVFCLLVKVVGETGFGLFLPLGLYMLMIAGGLCLHMFVILPLLLRVVGKIAPLAWGRAMAPALMTAFSASSSSMTLPVTMECAEKRGGVSNKVSSFVLPLGATINMDGTALYECAGVIFLSQYYASVGGVPLGIGDQVFVVLMALTASIGAAGIPSAGLVMMVTILSALKLPIEGAALLLAVDRPLDMLRTAVNVWSDSCGTALIAKSEGERLAVEAPVGETT